MSHLVFMLKHTAKEFIRRRILPWLPPKLRVRIRTRLNPPKFPSHVFIEPTTQCNLRCLHCGRTYWKNRDQHRDIDFDLFVRTVDELSKSGTKELTVQGLGEPLLHPRIFDLIDYARSRGLYTRFTSNFTILTDEMAERLVRSDHSEVVCSIESIDPELFSDIRRRGNLQDVLRNLARLSSAKARLHSTRPVIIVSAVLLHSTLHLYERLAAEVKEAGANVLSFQGLNTDGIPETVRLRNGSRMVDNALNTLPSDQIERIASDILSLSSLDMLVRINGDIGGRDTLHRPSNGIRTCSELWEAPYIDSAGRVTPCCWLPDGDIMTLGDLKAHSFRDIWYSDAYETLRKQHLTNQHPPVCRKCQALNHYAEAPYFSRGQKFKTYHDSVLSQRSK